MQRIPQFSKIIKLADAQSRKSFASLFAHETRMRVGCPSACLNLQFGHLRWTLMPCQMDKIRANVCEERPAAAVRLRYKQQTEVTRDRTEGKWTKNARKTRASSGMELRMWWGSNRAHLPGLFATNSRPAGKIRLTKCYFCSSGAAKAKSASFFAPPHPVSCTRMI